MFKYNTLTVKHMVCFTLGFICRCNSGVLSIVKQLTGCSEVGLGLDKDTDCCHW